MKNIIFIVFSITITSCYEPDVRNFYYPDKNTFDTNNLATVDLNTIDSYGSFFNILDNLMCEGKKVNVVLHAGSSVYNLQPKYRCLKDFNGPPEFRMREILRIRDDSIIRRTTEYDFTFIHGFMSNFYNNRFNGDFPKNLGRGILIISFSDTTGKEKIMTNLKKVFDSFNRINSVNKDSLRLNILFVENRDHYYFREIVPPPPLTMQLE